MKISDLNTFYVKPGWMFLKVSTDDALCGYGELDLAGPVNALNCVAHEMGALLRGEDPRQIERLWHRLREAIGPVGGPMAFAVLSAIEQALWDITGKAAGLPVHAMLGGACRSKIRMQAISGGDAPEDAATIAKGFRLKHYKAIKITIDAPTLTLESKDFIDRQSSRLRAVRAAVGDDMDIAVSLRGRCGASLAVRLIRAMEPFAPVFFEDPCGPNNLSDLAQIAHATGAPLAVGNGLYTRWAFRDVLEARSLSVAQPDVCQTGGILEARKIAAMAETYGVTIAPRNARGPISLAASLQLAACVPNFLALEHPALLSRWDVGHGILTKPFEIRGGAIPVPEGPGLGITVNEAAFAERIMAPDWKPDLTNHPEEAHGFER